MRKCDLTNTGLPSVSSIVSSILLFLLLLNERRDKLKKAIIENRKLLT